MDTVMKTAKPTPSSTTSAPPKPRRQRTPAEEAILLSVATVLCLENRYPEQLRQIPSDIWLRLDQGDLSAWADLLRRDPALFRQAPFNRIEDMAFDFLLGKLSMAEPKKTNQAAATNCPNEGQKHGS
jgi:hypothetical protein